LTWASYPSGQHLDQVWFSGFLIVLRLLRLVRMRYLSDLVQERFWSSCAIMYQVAQMLLVVLVFAHFSACGWYGVGRPVENSTEGWVARLNLQDKPLGDRYLAALHWAVCQFTLAGGTEASPVSGEEKLYAVIIPLISVVVLYPLLGRIVIVMNQLWISEAKRNVAEV